MSTKSPVKGAAWTRVAIFISLYAVLLESLIDLVLVIYLYAIERVDSKMTPSLILALVASFCGLPLVFLHSLAAWQYNKVPGFANQKTMLHAGCTYLLRLGIAVWLAASVAGLVVVAQQAECLPEGTDAGFWKVGISCGIHRTVFIVAVVSFLTVCVFFCARELCDRPYDVSLLGVYKSQTPNRDESIFSNSSWESESTLKNDVVCLCRHPDGTPGPYCQLPGDGGPGCKPSIKHPRPVHPKPLLTINTAPESETTVSPCGSSQAHTPTDLYPSRTSTLITSSTTGQGQGQISPVELPGPETPRQDLIPKANPTRPLSADPQIKALSEPSREPGQGGQFQSEYPLTTQKQDPNRNQNATAIANSNPSDAPEPVSISVPRKQDQQPNKTRRAYTSNVPPPRPPPPATPTPTPPGISGPGSGPGSGCTSMSINHPHHPNYIPPYPLASNSKTDRLRPQTTSPVSPASPGQGPRSSRNLTNPNPNPNPNPNMNFRRSLTNPNTYYSNINHFDNGSNLIPRRHSNSSMHNFYAQDQIQAATPTPTPNQSQNQNQNQNQSQYYTLNGLTLRRPPRRSSSLRLQHPVSLPFLPHTTGDGNGNGSTNGTGNGNADDGPELPIYPNPNPIPRRPRSSTFGYGYGPTRLHSIKEVTGPRGSVDGGEEEEPVLEQGMYRGADRTSFVGI